MKFAFSRSLLLAGLFAAGSTLFAAAPLKVLLVAGGSSHDYPAQKDILRNGIMARANIVIDIVHEGTTREHKVSIYNHANWADGYDAVIHDECFGFVDDIPFVEGIVAAHKQRGLGAVLLHCSSHSYRNALTEEWRKLVGIQSRRHDKRRPFDAINVRPTHPVMIGFPKVWPGLDDELYNNIQIWPNVVPLATAHSIESNLDHVVAWVNTYEKARVFTTTLGHSNQIVADPIYLDLVTRGLLWSCGKLDDQGKPVAGYETPPAPVKAAK